MAKYMHVLHEDTNPPARRPRVLGKLLLVILLICSPFIYEGGLIVQSQWKALFGTYVDVKTPMLDWAGSTWQSIHAELKYQTPALLTGRRLPPIAIVGAIAGLAIFGSMFLRRG